MRSRSKVVGMLLASAAASVIAGCGQSIADATVPKGQWAIRTIGGYRVPYDTTRVGTYVLAETLTVDAHPAQLRITQVLLTRELNNSRVVKFDTVTMSLAAGLGCSKFKAGDTKQERESREHMRTIRGEIYRMGGSRGYTYSQEIGEGPFAVEFGTGTLSLLDPDCAGSGAARTYTRVNPAP